MKHIIDYLDQAKTITGSDRQTAFRLGISQGYIATIRGGKSISDDLCLQLAELLDIDPMEIIAAKNAERTKSPEMRKKWEAILKSVAAVLVVAVGLASPAEDAQAGFKSARFELNNTRYYAHIHNKQNKANQAVTL